MSESSTPHNATLRPLFDLFLVSALILFLELACIRWFPAHVILLTFFTNVVLLACFLGMSVGCLAARGATRHLQWSPLLLCLAMGMAHGTAYLRARHSVTIDAGRQQSNPQVVFFGAEYEAVDADHFAVPIEIVVGAFFIVVALVMVGPGQELGRALLRIPNRVQAYSVNIAGSLVGIVAFTLFSMWELPPPWWFSPVAVGVLYLLATQGDFSPIRWGTAVAALGCGLYMSDPSYGVRGENGRAVHRYWSPYYRIDYAPAPKRDVVVNLIGHQTMRSLDDATPAYPLPHLFNRDSGGKPFKNVLIIGAGSGNDVSRALQWGAERVDAVEIDPVIHRLGARDHPNKPFDDPRVSVHLDDGRNFLRSAETAKYDLVIYGLVDSLVLHSSFSNIRLESYLFTRQAFQDVRRCLKEDGLFAMYNYYRQGWIVARLNKGLEEIFGEGNPLAFTLPYLKSVPEDSAGGFTLFLAGRTGPIRRKFEVQPSYWLADAATPTTAPNGFRKPPDGAESGWLKFGIAEIVPPRRPLPAATDDWPFLYLRKPMIPAVSLGGAAIMAGLAFAMILWFLPRDSANDGWRFDGRMFFLGAGFMLVETKAVVHMALLFGSTWKVNAFVFFAVLVMILAANLFVLRVGPTNLWPYYLSLFAALALNLALPLDSFLGMDRTLQVVGSSLLVFAPIMFAGVIFAVSFARTAQADLAFGANIAGAMLGGLAEYTSMLLGFQGLLWVAGVFYGLSAILGERRTVQRVQ